MRAAIPAGSGVGTGPDPKPPVRPSSPGSPPGGGGENGGAATRILLEGRPGAGKTTALRRLAALLPTRPATGFTTEEIRQAGARVGFALETLAGRREVLAHVDLPGPPRVGKYGVDLGVMERLALPTLRPTATAESAGRLVLIDELGRMELACTAFQDAVDALLVAEVDVVATVHTHRDPFTDALRRRADIEVVHLTAANRDALPGKLAARLQQPGTRQGPPAHR